MKSRILKWLLQQLTENLTPEMLKAVADAIMDAIEKHVKETPSPKDDKIILPMLKVIHEALNIPDDD